MQISETKTHLHVQLPHMHDMPDLLGTSHHDEEQQGPALGTLDVRGDIEQNIEDMPMGPAKEFLLHEKRVMESVALAYLQPEQQVNGLGHDFLPLPLMRHEAILWKEKMRPALPRNEDGGYEGITLTTEEAKALVEDHPKWWKKWLHERLNDLTNVHNAPQALQIDPTYCLVLCRRTWQEFQRWRAKNKSMLNYPILSAQSQPTVTYVVNTLNTTITLLRDVADLACQMLVKIARMIVTCIQLRRSRNRRNANINALLEPTSKGGLRKDAIALLPTFIYRVTSISDEVTGNSLENTGFLQCAICLTEFQHKEQGRMLPACKHSFHMECIDMWFYSHSTCPLCRAAVTPAVAMSAGTSSHNIPTAASSTHEQQEPGADEEAATGHDIQNSINAPPSPHNSDNIVPQRCSAATIGPQELDCENAIQVPSSSSDGVVTIRSLPHITIQIPTR
ncbi:hypothetical protein L7F22_025975 [Adiantum nelumboides]|nr:hypothetical protein [Adiantum nelumboides]